MTKAMLSNGSYCLYIVFSVFPSFVYLSIMIILCIMGVSLELVCPKFTSTLVS